MESVNRVLIESCPFGRKRADGELNWTASGSSTLRFVLTLTVDTEVDRYRNVKMPTATAGRR